VRKGLTTRGNLGRGGNWGGKRTNETGLASEKKKQRVLVQYNRKKGKVESKKETDFERTNKGYTWTISWV